MNLTDTTSQSQIVQLLRKLRDESVMLVSQQVSLAKTEISEKVSDMMEHAVQLAIGGCVAYAGLIIILFAVADLLSSLLIRMGLSPQISMWLARAIIGVVVAVTGWVMVMRAKKLISQQPLAPKQTLESLSRDKEWAEHKVQTSLSS
ncbi:MAG TPA: phage holin family protein [Opitutaceae bacterium]